MRILDSPREAKFRIVDEFFCIEFKCPASTFTSWKNTHYAKLEDNMFILLQLDYWLNSRNIESKLTVTLSKFYIFTWLILKYLLRLHKKTLKGSDLKVWERFR